MYEINDSTLFIKSINEDQTMIYEETKEFEVTDSVGNIVNNSCKYFGSSYLGRLAGTKRILGVNYKAPIVIEESSEMIFFPTSSPRLKNCSWLSLKKVMDYKKNGEFTTVVFSNSFKIDIEMSYSSFDNQILRAARLQMLLKNRKIRNNY